MSHHLPIAGSKDEPLYAIGARFDKPEALVRAVEHLRSEGITAYECFTPYPVHGLAESMRLPKSILSFLVLGGGASAILIALLMEIIPSTLIYPLVVDGKPLNLLALPQYIPIVVALTLMIGAITAVFGMILLGGMPKLNNPMFAWDLFAKEASRGFFMISVQGMSPQSTWRPRSPHRATDHTHGTLFPLSPCSNHNPGGLHCRIARLFLSTSQDEASSD
jgi:hypothetical protein